ncbi:MAG TPA: heavy metal-binding domain-containing protein [Acidimicrobiales bacterium]|nr:heavy metal-binding domain-containing protein [Acidimicrobiales bacterium]
MQAPPELPSYNQQHAQHLAGSRPLIVTTTENIPEARVVTTIGQVFGLTVRSRSLGGNIAAWLKGLVGGEVRSYVKLNEDARRQAIDRMVHNAAAMGANAVTMMRFDSTEMARSMSEIVAYGTARVVEWQPAPTEGAGEQG